MFDKILREGILAGNWPAGYVTVPILACRALIKRLTQALQPDIDMLRSMTAYGRHETEAETGKLVWELRSVNHRYLELALRLPEQFRSLEPSVREYLGKQLKRGKVDVMLRFTPAAKQEVDLSLNRDLAERLLAEAESLAQSTKSKVAVDAMSILSWPGVLQERQDENKRQQTEVMQALQLALQDYIDAREREGSKIEDMLQARCSNITTIVREVRELRPAVVQRLQKRMRQRFADLDIEADPARLEQEMVLQAQKLDVVEELDRLDAHLAEMQSIFKRDEPVGRRLDFLIQEFNREANTLGSKSADSDTTRHTVELKVLIEQMREQVQNLE